jgi:hypothetical protein
MDERQGIEVVDLLDLPKVIPVHFDDYTVFALARGLCHHLMPDDAPAPAALVAQRMGKPVSARPITSR